MRWLVLALVACHPKQPDPPPTPTFAPPKPKPPVARPMGHSIDAGVPPVVGDAGTPAGDHPDPPEPTAPQLECKFTRSTFCIAGQPTITALQPSPFEYCARTQPARAESLIAGEAQFSAAETRAKRATQADACCYIEFSTHACR